MQKNSTFKDTIHKVVWDKNPINKKKGKYVCTKCHTPTADKLSQMIFKGTEGIPDTTHNEVISYTYYHRVEGIKDTKKSKTNIISKKVKHFFRNIKDPIKNNYHTTSSDNQDFKDGSCI